MSVEHFQHLVDTTFQQIESRLNGAAAGPLHAARREALEAFKLQGVPTTRHEEWKYTNVLPSLGAEYSIQRFEARADDAAEDTSLTRGMNYDAYRIQLVNGRLDERSLLLPDDGSVDVHVLNDAYIQAHPEAATWIDALTPVNTHPFVAANTAMMDGGVVIRVRRGFTHSLPLNLRVVTDTRNGAVVSTPRILIVVESNAVCTVIEEHISLGSYASFLSSVTQIVAEADSKPTYVKIIGETQSATTHIGHTSAVVHKHASLTCVTLCLGGRLTRNELEIRLVESGAETRLYGLSVLSDNELADNHTLVDHVAPHCHSEEEYKGVYDGRSTGVFNGKIMVRPDAQKTTAYQSNRSVLLSPTAQINAKPQLEIFADDVKCSHGATCGQIDEEAVFYLQSRGIGFDDARALIVYAFAADIVEHVPHAALRTLVDRRIAEKLGAHPFDL